MNSVIELSIIVPVYNGEKYVERAIKSVLNTKNINFELIIINDCSTDATIKILNLYEKYNNIKVINLKNNKGVSYCRNRGISEANGKYITFLDADDYISEGMYEDLLGNAYNNDYDVCICSHYLVNEKSNKKIKSRYNLQGTYNGKETVKLLLLDKVSASPCDKIIKKEKIIENYSESLKVGEDFLFWLENCYSVSKVYITNKFYYNYVQRDNSTMHTISEKLLQVLDIEKYMSNNLLEFLYKECNEELKFFELKMITRCINSISVATNKENKKNAIQYIKKVADKETLKKIIKNPYTSKYTKMEMSILLIFGTNIHLWLMPIYKKIKEIMFKKTKENN